MVVSRVKKSRKKRGNQRRLGLRRRGSGNRGGFGKAGHGKRAGHRIQKFLKQGVPRKKKGGGFTLQKRLRKRLITGS